MAVLNIRDVPDDARDDLATEARAQGLSMQKYLLNLVLAEARRAHNRALLANVRAGLGSGGAHRSPDETAELVRSLREERAEHLGSLVRGDE